MKMQRLGGAAGPGGSPTSGGTAVCCGSTGADANAATVSGPLPGGRAVSDRLVAVDRAVAPAAEPVNDSGTGEPDDAELIERSLREPEWFARIFDRHADEILRYAHARLGPDLAEDVTAETFLAAFGRRARYDLSYRDARPWLYGIAVRQIGRHRRAESRHRAALARLPAESAERDFGDRSAERVPELLRRLPGMPVREPAPRTVLDLVQGGRSRQQVG